MSITIGSTSYRNRAEALTGELGLWAAGGDWPETLDDEAIADISEEIRDAGGLADDFGDVTDAELADAIQAHDEWVRERRAKDAAE